MFELLIRRAAQVAASAGLLGATALLGQWPSGTEPHHAVLRLAWRLPGERVKLCHELSEEELARVPIHMRRPQECREWTLAYSLSVAVDGREVRTRTLTPPGVHRDRPLFVHEDLALEPGVHEVTVRFAPVAPAIDGALTPAEAEQVAAAVAAARTDAFDGALDFPPARVRMLTYRGAEPTLTVVDSASRAAGS
ncbi:MAG: hypothetical protein HYV63_25850 [Candidatus Schekmanbacteria bacterium]|nr:hypothetical protein [Candidatus Schekmanbacteria bacterium]